jgi:hypothetical protein
LGRPDPSRCRKRLKISVIKVTLRTVPCSDDEIRQERLDRNQQAVCSTCLRTSHQELAA